MRTTIRTLFLLLLATTAAYGAGPDYTRDTCPVIGNSKSMIYHTPASENYHRLLKARRKGEDHRTCFVTEQQAKDAGYRKARR